LNSVTPDDMQRVDIKPGWLIYTFIQNVFRLEGGPIDHGDNYRLWATALRLLYVGEPIIEALIEYDKLVYQKNLQYKDAWQQDGPITALVDLKDKLYRLESASETGAIIAWDKDKLTGTLFDILIRTVMCLSWFGLNFKDDDDDRRGKQE
jgi:hypothetical protein